jgi:hypothetical protein
VRYQLSYFFLKNISVLSLIFCTAACAPGGTKPGQLSTTTKGETPSPESKTGCLALIGSFAPKEKIRLETVTFTPSNHRSIMSGVIGGAKFELIVGADPTEREDGVTLAASCNSADISLSILSASSNVFFKFRWLNATEIEILELDESGALVGKWTASKSDSVEIKPAELREN